MNVQVKNICKKKVSHRIFGLFLLGKERGGREMGIGCVCVCGGEEKGGGGRYSGSLPLILQGVCLFGWFLNVLINYYVISRTGPKTERLTILRAATHETELGDHDFCLSRSHYTDTDPTSRERAATTGIEPGTSSQGVARSTD